jgi:hypothetical protein
MAVTLVINKVTISGRAHTQVRVDETSATTTSDVELVGVPIRGTIVSFRATLTAGSGATINPGLGLATGWTDSTQEDIGRNTSTAAHVSDQTRLRFDTAADTPGSIWLQWAVDAGADNTVFAEILILDGWAE